MPLTLALFFDIKGDVKWDTFKILRFKLHLLERTLFANPGLFDRT